MFQVEHLGQALRWLRLNRGVMQHEVARKAGITGPMLSKYEHSKTMPTLPVLSKILEAMGCDLSDLASALEMLSGGSGFDEIETPARPPRSWPENALEVLLEVTFGTGPLAEEEERAFGEMLSGYCRWLRFLRETAHRRAEELRAPLRPVL